MRRLLALLLAIFIAAMPLAGLAAAPADAPSSEMPCHGAGPGSADKSSGGCHDMKGCCAAALASPVLDTHDLSARDERARPAEGLITGFVPDPADRPPVAL